ncbi:MAG: nickel pincer cofactor biosynthesis protein LarC [Actinomycetota bacterium]|nr:nickel pincer cofactor biosynthesis protein LarC [Actinomycetota bacterium]
MTLAWFQCLAGASGDMFLAALVDAGAPLDVVQASVDAVDIEPVRLVVEPTERHGIGATRVQVHVPRTTVVRTWGNIRDLLDKAELDDGVRARALDVFQRLATAEAAVHRTSPEQVHFHEVGGHDAIADVVGTCAALEALGVDDAVAGPVALGHGMVRSAHGLLPVPAPAVVALLADAGAPVHSGPAPYEMCTPTGAALLAATVRRWGALPAMRVSASGFGAGSRDLDEVPNVLRVVLGEPVADVSPASSALVLEANVDDLDPRLWPPVIARLLEAGASDAWLTPILMKKGRPAHTLSVLVAAEQVEAVRRVVFTETTSLGVREQPVAKSALERRMLRVDVGGEPVDVKLGLLGGAVVNAQPEYEHVAAAAARLGRPVKSVLAAATAAAHAALEGGGSGA